MRSAPIIGPDGRRERGPIRQRHAVYRLVGHGALAETPLLARLLEESSPCGVLENLANTLVGLGGALKVLESVDLASNSLTL